MFSVKEKNRRLKAVSGFMGGAGLGAIYLPGNSTVGWSSFGCNRYFTNRRVVFQMTSVVLIRDMEPVAVVNDLMGKMNLIENSFVGDAVINEDQIDGVIGILREHGIERGRVGTVLDILPAAWLLRLREAFPNVEFVDVSGGLYPMRTIKSDEEVEVQRICSAIAVAGYEAICDTVKPGMYESEVVAALEKAMQSRGAEESFALVTSGKFSIIDNKLPALHNYAAFDRKIEEGDVVAVEITPRYCGYWTQIVRTVCVGEKNKDADEIRRIVIGAIEAAKPVMRAKTRVCDVVRSMREHTEGAGYMFVMPCGHITAVDLAEEDLTEDNERQLEAGMLIVLHPTVITSEMDTSIFWGESYIITDEGYEEPMRCSGELFVAGTVV